MKKIANVQYTNIETIQDRNGHWSRYNLSFPDLHMGHGLDPSPSMSQKLLSIILSMHSRQKRWLQRCCQRFHFRRRPHSWQTYIVHLGCRDLRAGAPPGILGSINSFVVVDHFFSFFNFLGPLSVRGPWNCPNFSPLYGAPNSINFTFKWKRTV